MMMDEQRSRVAKLKAVIAASDSRTGGVPQAVRSAVIALRQELRAEGTTARTLATMLGLHESTLSRWGRESEAEAMVGAGRGAGFRMVQVGSEAKSAALAPPTCGGLRVAHAPSGIVVDGLDVETLAALLRRLS
jgi:peptidoglycan hydrolase-like amidase